MDTGSRAGTRDTYMVHAAFRREFGALRNLVRNVQAGDIQRSQIIADHIDIPQDRAPIGVWHDLVRSASGVIQKSLSELRPEVRRALQEQGPRAFSAHSEHVYGTATPPRSGLVMRSLKNPRP